MMEATSLAHVAALVLLAYGLPMVARGACGRLIWAVWVLGCATLPSCGSSERSNDGPGGASGSGTLAGGGAGDAGDANQGGSPAGSGGSAGNATAGTGNAGAAGMASCLPEPEPAMSCADLIEGAVLERFSVELEVDAPRELSLVPGIAGESALRLDTQAAFLVTLRFAPEVPLDTGSDAELRLLLRGKNDNIGWQGNVPAFTFEDGAGRRRTYTPAGASYPSDGTTWLELRVPLAGGNGYAVSGEELDWTDVSAIEITADTWDAGFVLDLDGLGFVPAGASCSVTCAKDCSGRGSCEPDALGCVCELGAEGPACATCRAGFDLENGHCMLQDDASHDVWPNAVSKTNGDAWLAVHHQEVKRLEPRVLALNFVNPSNPASVATLLDQVIAGFREGSRAQGYAHADAAPALEYQLVDIVDLRDGVAGRPAAPGDYAYENSTLFPRRGDAEAGAWRFDYAQLFSGGFAQHYGFEDPEAPGEYLTLCELIESGELHELWVVGSGDVPDVNAAEVLEYKQRYDRARNPIVGSFDGCAGNGCFDADVPKCARSVRIGFVNYNRGPGCYLHSQGHGLESVGRRELIPALSEWFVPFAGFDLDRRYGLPGQSFYELLGDENYASYPSPDELVTHRNGSSQSVKPYSASCGNVHFPPNAVNHYDYSSLTPVHSECADFGRNVLECREREQQQVNSADWAEYEALSPDCGGAFLVRWFQSMPSAASGQYFGDGRPMLSVWPFWYY